MNYLEQTFKATKTLNDFLLMVLIMLHICILRLFKIDIQTSEMFKLQTSVFFVYI